MSEDGTYRAEQLSFIGHPQIEPAVHSSNAYQANSNAYEFQNTWGRITQLFCSDFNRDKWFTSNKLKDPQSHRLLKTPNYNKQNNDSMSSLPCSWSQYNNLLSCKLPKIRKLLCIHRIDCGLSSSLARCRPAVFPGGSQFCSTTVSSGESLWGALNPSGRACPREVWGAPSAASDCPREGAEGNESRRKRHLRCHVRRLQLPPKKQPQPSRQSSAGKSSARGSGGSALPVRRCHLTHVDVRLLRYSLRAHGFLSLNKYPLPEAPTSSSGVAGLTQRPRLIPVRHGRGCWSWAVAGSRRWVRAERALRRRWSCSCRFCARSGRGGEAGAKAQDWRWAGPGQLGRALAASFRSPRA